MSHWTASGAGDARYNDRYNDSGATYNGQPIYIGVANGMALWMVAVGSWVLSESLLSWAAYTNTFQSGLPGNPWDTNPGDGGENEGGTDPPPTLALGPFTVSGTVTVDAVGQNGVVIRMGSSATVTAGGGLYSFAEVFPGSYTVYPRCTRFSYVPAETTVDVTTADVPNIDFAGTAYYPSAAYGAALTVNAEAVAEVTRLRPERTGEVVDVTGHNSPQAFREFVGALRGGNLDIEALHTTTGYGRVVTAAQSRALGTWRIEYGNGDWWEGQCLCLGATNPAVVDGVLRFTANLRVSGLPTCSWD